MQEQRNQLLGLKQKLGKARSELSLATAQLKQAKDDYRRRVVLAQAQARVALRVSVNSVERLQVAQELKLLERQISATGRVSTPHDGVVKKIKWLGMVDQNFQVEVSFGIEESKHETLTR